MAFLFLSIFLSVSSHLTLPITRQGKSRAESLAAGVSEVNLINNDDVISKKHYYTAPLTIGSNAQNFSLLFDTGSKV